MTPLLLFSYLGFESGNSAAGEMKNPARDVPIAIARSAGIAAAAYLLPIFAILVVLPKDDITGIGGLMEAVAKVFSVYGAAAPAMLTVTGVIFAVILMTQGSAWMIISDRMQAMAAADGAFFGGFFGRFHPQLGTPVRVNLLSGAVATVFCLVAMQVTGSSAAIFGVVLSISISTFLLSYVISIPAAVRLRTRFPDVPRPFRVPTGNTGFRILGGLCFAWVALGSWVAVFPGTLERLLGLDYDFAETWGVSQLTFELFTLGTLAVLGILGAVATCAPRPCGQNVPIPHRWRTQSPRPRKASRAAVLVPRPGREYQHAPTSRRHAHPPVLRESRHLFVHDQGRRRVAHRTVGGLGRYQPTRAADRHAVVDSARPAASP